MHYTHSGNIAMILSSKYEVFFALQIYDKWINSIKLVKYWTGFCHLEPKIRYIPGKETYFLIEKEKRQELFLTQFGNSSHVGVAGKI